MFQIDEPTAATSLPTPATAGTPGYFTGGNPGSGVPATILDADFMNMVMLELTNIVTAAGLTPSKTTYTQVLQAIRTIATSPACVLGLSASNNATTPTTQYNILCSSVTMRDSAGDAYTVLNPAVLTLNAALAGPVANGRDVSGAFSASQWLRMYYIYNPTTATLATIISAAVPTVGPALPPGYTAWAYIGSIFWNSLSNLSPSIFKGSWFQYTTPAVVLAAGTATSLTSVSLTSAIPPEALQLELLSPNLSCVSSTTYTLTCAVVIQGTAIAFQFGLQGSGTSGIAAGVAGPAKRLQNVGQNFAYQLSITAGTSPSVTFWVSGYNVPNGGE